MKKPILFLMIMSVFIIQIHSEGKWEFGVHYSFWNIDILKPVIEEMTPPFESYDPDRGALNFNSNGNNYGVEFRFFPSGKHGSFSIGISYERNNFKAKIDGQYEDIIQGYPADITGNGTFEVLPHSVNIGMRWEIMPKKRIHPYMGFSIGVGSLKGGFKFNVQTIVHKPGEDIIAESIDEDWTIDETLEALENEGKSSYPLRIMPIIHINIGVRGEITKNFYGLLEFAIYNGIIFRGGIAYRL